MELDRDTCYSALKTRDPRFDGRFFTGVLSTGVYCRPVCPARTPKPENCLFLPSAAAAQEAGFRPCLRCRPETAPELAVRRGTANTVSRALALISDGALDDGDLEGLADRLGVGTRHLRRLFERHLGAAPVAVAQTRRVLFAKTLLDETDLPMTEVALAAGFGSLRRFNDVMRRAFGRPPRDLRRTRREERPASIETGVTLRLSYSPPYDWEGLLGFLAFRAIPGVESVEGGIYRRTFELGGRHGVVEVAPAEGAPALAVRIRFADLARLPQIVNRLRRLFDLSAHPEEIAAHLSRDPRLSPLIAARPGLRVPGAWDGFEMAVRAVLGQQVSVAAATTFAGRIVAACGTPLDAALREAAPGLTHVFPRPETLAAAPLTGIGLTGARARSIAALSAAVAAEPDLLAPSGAVERQIERLVALPGIGDWTAQYIAMRALRDPDAFPASDLGVRRALKAGGTMPDAAEVARRAEAWRPWRAYATLALWLADATPLVEEPV